MSTNLNLISYAEMDARRAAAREVSSFTGAGLLRLVTATGAVEWWKAATRGEWKRLPKAPRGYEYQRG